MRANTGKQTNPETFVLKCVRDWLKWQGWKVIRNQQGMGSEAGVPDLLAIRQGRHLWIEVKRPARPGPDMNTIPEGKLSPAQVAFADDLQKHGAEFLLVRCIEDLEAYLNPASVRNERMVFGG